MERQGRALKEYMRKKIREVIRELEENGRFAREKGFHQHGKTSIYAHSVGVAARAVWIADFLHLQVDERSLIRGALLHDYFLYDWHDKSVKHPWHGFRHPGTALARAREDYELNEIEQDIIARHMFPLTPRPPKYRESWIVSVADKLCATQEVISPILSALRRTDRTKKDADGEQKVLDK